MRRVGRGWRPEVNRVCRVAPLALAVAAVLLTALAAGAETAAPQGFVAPAKRDKCPVCGMFVAPYPEWTAELVFSDGSYAVFDGPKDLFRFYLDMARFGSRRLPADVRGIFVTDYYSLEPIEAESAFYVLGGDVLGPMGRELIPFRTREAAQGFLADHRGERIVVFGEIRDLLPRIVD